MKRFHQRLQKPHWWPENEEWPPRRSARHWRGMHPNPFFRRVGCLFRIFNFIGVVVFIFVVSYILNYFGIAHISIGSFSWLLIPVGILFTFFVIALLIFASIRLRRMSMPLDELLDASNKVAEGDYSARVQEQGWPRGPLVGAGLQYHGGEIATQRPAAPQHAGGYFTRIAVTAYDHAG